MREHEEHARGGVEARVASGEHRGEDHGVHERGGREQARVLEDEREGAHGDVGHVVPEKARVGVRNDQADDEDREDVEEQDSPEDLSDGLGNVLLGMLGFACGDADELGSLEGEAHHHGDADQGGKAAHEGCVADRPVLEARGRVAREDSEDHREARADEEDHGHDLEEREPVFRLAKAFYGYVVEREYEREEECAPECSGHVGEPPAHDELGGHKVDCDRNGPVVAVVPAEGEAEAFVDVAAAVG